MKIHHPKIVIPAAVIVALIVGFFGYQSINAPRSGYNATSTDDTDTSLNTTPSQNLSLGFLVGGRISAVNVKTGDSVKKGQVLATLDAGNALGALTQARAAYATAVANKEKIVNGATGATIDVAKAAVNTAQVNLDQVTKQQALLVANARKNYLNSTITAKTTNETSLPAPIISGTYNGDTEGVISMHFHQGGTTGGYITFSGLVTDGTSDMSTTAQQPIGNTGLTIEFTSSITPYLGTDWTITLPNTTAPNYLTNYNAYQSALQTQTQTVAAAQAALDQAKTSLTATVTAARPEDVAVAQAQVDNAYGALQIAQASYGNTIITAPADGTVTAVSISPGQIAMPNTTAIVIR